MNLFETYVTAYKTASIGDAFIGGMMANSVNGTTGDQPTYSDAQIVAQVKDPEKQDRLIAAMAAGADTDRGRFGKVGGGFLGGLAGGMGGLVLGTNLGGMLARKDNPDSKAPLIGAVTGTLGGGALGALLGTKVVEHDRKRRRREYAYLLARKVRALRGE